MAPDADVFGAARWVLLERMTVGFMDDMEHSLALIFASFGWPWVAGDVAKLSRNVNDRAKAATATPKGPAPAARAPVTASAEVDPMAVYLPRIASLNQWDAALYKEARAAYDEKQAALQRKQEAALAR